jgi:hypothetical protein
MALTFGIQSLDGKSAPAWDRAYDSTWTRDSVFEGTPSHAEDCAVSQFSHTVAKLSGHSSRRLPSKQPTLYFRLPESVRFRICLHLISSSEADDPVSKPVRLTHPAFDKAVWPYNHFEELNSACSRLLPFLLVCISFRYDIIATHLITRHFRITISPFVGRLLNAQGFDYLKRYGRYMKTFTLEVDLSTLGLGAYQPAELLPKSSGTCNISRNIGHVVRCLAQRRAVDHGLQELNVLIRRFGGTRNDSTAYCDDRLLSVVDALRGLGNFVGKVRMVGFSGPSAKSLASQLWPELPEEAGPLAKHIRQNTLTTMYSQFPTRLPGPARTFPVGDAGTHPGGSRITSYDDSTGDDMTVCQATCRSVNTPETSFLSVDPVAAARLAPLKDINCTASSARRRMDCQCLGHPALRSNHSLVPIVGKDQGTAQDLGEMGVVKDGRVMWSPTKALHKLKKKVLVEDRGTPLERAFG